MSYIKFDRHAIFGMDEVKFHSQTIRNIENLLIGRGESMFNNLTNMLSGIWDGYLYDELIPAAVECEIGAVNVARIQLTVATIKESVSLD